MILYFLERWVCHWITGGIEFGWLHKDWLFDIAGLYHGRIVYDSLYSPSEIYQKKVSSNFMHPSQFAAVKPENFHGLMTSWRH